MILKTLLLSLLFMFCMPGHGFAQKQNVLGKIFFETDSSTVSAAEYVKLKNFVNTTDSSEISKISVSAWCDDVGDKLYNERLSEKRAVQVKNRLIELSVPETIIEAKGNGEIALAGSQNIDRERTNNRRVDVTVVYTLKQKEKIAEEQKKKPVEKKISPLSDDQKVGDKITLENILFIGGRHFLLPESYDDLELLTTTLLEQKKYQILILGHICCVQDGKDGMDFDTGIANLSVARAKAIYDYLVAHGVSAKRLQYKGLKNDFPTGISDRADRRVEIEITKIVTD